MPGDQEHKMPTSRCVHLMLVGIASGVEEMWIAQQPFLLFYYAWQYTPTFAWFITKMLGRKRVRNFKAGLVGVYNNVLFEKYVFTKLIVCLFTLKHRLIVKVAYLE